MEDLDLSFNRDIGKETIKVLADEILENESYKLNKLSLEDIRLNDEGLKPLCSVL